MRVSFRFIGSLFRMAWSLVWGFIWTMVISFVILVGMVYFTGTSGTGMPGVARAAETVVSQVGTFLGQNNGKVSNGNLTTDGHTSSGARWSQAQATVYLDPNMDETFIAAYQEALDAWNQTGVFRFEIVSERDSADIFLTEMDDSAVSAAGEAESQTNLLTNRLTKVTVRLNRHYLLNRRYGYSYERIVNTAQHELGHALGLDHNEGQSVMQSAGSYYSIQSEDIEEVRALYGGEE